MTVNAFIRRLTVLSVLWSMCELLLPEGRHQAMVRMTVSVLILTSMLSGLSQWAGGTTLQPAWADQVLHSGEESYQRSVLRSLANQIENYCVAQSRKAGYEACAAVWLTQEGSVERIELQLKKKNGALLTPAQLADHLAQQLGTDNIHLEGS